MSNIAAQLVVLQSSTVYIPNLTSYQVTLEVTSAENIIETVFVKQRLRNTQNGVTDIFAAVASPNQLETLNPLAPSAGTSYFLDSQVCLIANTVEYLNSIVDDIYQQLQALVTDIQLISNFGSSSIVTITSGGITNSY